MRCGTSASGSPTSATPEPGPYDRRVSDAKPAQAWELLSDGRRHRVEVRGSISRRLTWTVDGAVVARARSSSDKIRVRAGDGLEDGEPPAVGDDLGAIGVSFTSLGRPRRATLHAPGEASDLALLTGAGGTDLHPEPGSVAARHEERLLAHPRRYAATQAAVAVAVLLVPLLLAALLARLAFAVPWPDLPSIPWPSIPWPDLPSIPWPDLPSIPWPDWSMPGWLSWLLDKAILVWPVVLAYVLASSEVRRRRRQVEARAERRDRQQHEAQQEKQEPNPEQDRPG